MLVNKQEIRLKAGASVDGPQGYFKVVVDRVEGADVLGWHVEDNKGNRSHNLGGAGIANIDLVLGQGRITGQAILKDVGKALLERTYNAAAPATPAESSLPPALIAGLALAALALAAVAYELGRRKSRAS